MQGAKQNHPCCCLPLIHCLEALSWTVVCSISLIVTDYNTLPLVVVDLSIQLGTVLFISVQWKAVTQLWFNREAKVSVKGI